MNYYKREIYFRFNSVPCLNFQSFKAEKMSKIKIIFYREKAETKSVSPKSIKIFLRSFVQL